MAVKCAWCHKADATHKVLMETDGTTAGWRFFCNAQHQANWETNQPRNVAIGIGVEAATMWEIVKEANLDSWFLVSLGQFGGREKPQWRAVFQRRTERGATEEVFTCFEDGPDPRLAVLHAYKDTQKLRKMQVDDPVERAVRSTKVYTGKIPPALEKRLSRAIDDNWIARKRYEARRDSGDDDL